MSATSKRGIIFIASDHAGFKLKQILMQKLGKDFPDLMLEDLGCLSEQSVDYPEYAARVARKVSGGEGCGILLCGTGIGMSIAANKIHGVRAAVAWDCTSARLSREHNDSNIVCLGSRVVGPESAHDICSTWLSTKFLGDRHKKRVDLIRKMEKQSDG